jgi:hypothetical protein
LRLRAVNARSPSVDEPPLRGMDWWAVQGLNL